jgi:hypothetical protein
MPKAEEKVTKKKRNELRCDLRDGFCCVCEKELPTEGATVVKSSRVLGLDKGSLPNCFSVCERRCANFLDSKDKLARPLQRVLLRRMSRALLETDVLVGDKVTTIQDMPPNRYIEAGEGTVHNIKSSSSSSSSSSSVLDSERGYGEILVKMAVGGHIVHVGPSGLSRIADDDADDDAGRSRPVKVDEELERGRLAGRSRDVCRRHPVLLHLVHVAARGLDEELERGRVASQMSSDVGRRHSALIRLVHVAAGLDEELERSRVASQMSSDVGRRSSVAYDGLVNVVALTRSSSVAAVPNNVLAELCQNQLARI